jgi:hypothetical protein
MVTHFESGGNNEIVVKNRVLGRGKLGVDSILMKVDSKSVKVDSISSRVDSKTQKVDSIFMKVDSKWLLRCLCTPKLRLYPG